VPERTPTKARSIEDLLEKQDVKLCALFRKVMNAHAAYQVSPRSDNELLGDIRDAIQESCSEGETGETQEGHNSRPRRGRRVVVEEL